VTAVSETDVSVEKIDYIPQGQAVLLKRIAAEVEEPIIAGDYMGEETEIDAEPAIAWIGTDEGVDVGSITTGTVYVLYNDGFTRATTGTIPANRGYLLLSTIVAPAGSRLAIIEGMSSDLSEKVRVDSERTASTFYDLLGRRVRDAQPDSQSSILNSQLKKGMYIIKGKKTIIK